jgi:hypothetical protein
MLIPDSGILKQNMANTCEVEKMYINYLDSKMNEIQR